MDTGGPDLRGVVHQHRRESKAFEREYASKRPVRSDGPGRRRHLAWVANRAAAGRTADHGGVRAHARRQGGSDVTDSSSLADTQ